MLQGKSGTCPAGTLIPFGQEAKPSRTAGGRKPQPLQLGSSPPSPSHHSRTRRFHPLQKKKPLTPKEKFDKGLPVQHIILVTVLT